MGSSSLENRNRIHLKIIKPDIKSNIYYESKRERERPYMKLYLWIRRKWTSESFKWYTNRQEMIKHARWLSCPSGGKDRRQGSKSHFRPQWFLQILMDFLILPLNLNPWLSFHVYLVQILSNSNLDYCNSLLHLPSAQLISLTRLSVLTILWGIISRVHEI